MPCDAELPELLGDLSQCSAEDGAWTGAWGCGLAQEGVCWCWCRGRTFRLSQLHSTRLLENIGYIVEVGKGMNASLNGIFPCYNRQKSYVTNLGLHLRHLINNGLM